MKKKYERDLLADNLLKDGEYKSIKQMLERIRSMIPNARVLGTLNENKEIIYWTAKELADEVYTLGDGLLAMGLEGKHIAILSDNCVRYVIADMSISTGVGVVTPIDKDAPASLMETLLTKCDADAALCSAHLVEKLKEIQQKCPRLKTLITIDKKVEGLPSYEDVLELGQKPENRGRFEKKQTDLSKPAKILFTSGTTGANKGVVLTGENLAANIMNCLNSIEVGADQTKNTSMSILPMHHATEINTHIMPRIGAGRLTYINDSMKNMMSNMKIFKPYVITVVPMIANAFYKQIWAGAERAGKAEKLSQGIKITNLMRKLGIDKTHELFSDVYAPFGGNLTQIICGGSMLNPKVVKGLSDLGMFVVNGYGITECGPLISMNTDTLKDYKSVGKACAGLEARILNPDADGIGELAVRGKSVAKGYYKDPENTAKVFDKDGFFHTGDSARMDEHGSIFLAGRKKNTIVLPNGKNVSPEEVENLIEIHLPYVTEVVVYQASNRDAKVICAGLWISNEAARGDILQITEDIRKVNAMLSDYKRVDFVQLAQKEYEKTSTRKIKRDGLPDYCDKASGIII